MERVRELLRSDEGGGARTLGGLLLATGVLVLLFRRTAFADPWGDGAVFWLIFLTAAFLYGIGFLGARLSATTHGWQRAFVTFGLVLTPAAGLTFVEWIGGSTDAPLNTTWIFLLTALAGFAAALVAGVRVGCLFGGIALIIAWLGLWDELLSEGLGGDFGTLRGLLVVIALILLAIAAVVSVRGRPEGGGTDVVTAAGLAAVGAGAITLATIVVGPFFVSPGVPGSTVDSPFDTSVFWDLELLVASLGLLLYSGVSGFRGPGYVGALGLLSFIYVVGGDLDDSSPAGKVVGWPLILLLIGAALLVWSVLPALRRTPD